MKKLVVVVGCDYGVSLDTKRVLCRQKGMKTTKAERKRKLVQMLFLQRDFIVEALEKLKEAVEVSDELDKADDPTLIEAYSTRIDKIMDQVEESNRIANDIEKALKQYA